MVATGRNSRPPRNCAALFGPTSARSLTMITEVFCGSEPYEVATKKHKKHKRPKRRNFSLRNLCVLCVSAVSLCLKVRLTAETQRTQRLRRAEIGHH